MGSVHAPRILPGIPSVSRVCRTNSYDTPSPKPRPAELYQKTSPWRHCHYIPERTGDSHQCELWTSWKHVSTDVFPLVHQSLPDYRSQRRHSRVQSFLPMIGSELQTELGDHLSTRCTIALVSSQRDCGTPRTRVCAKYLCLARMAYHDHGGQQSSKRKKIFME